MGDDNTHGPTIVALLAVLVTGAVGYAGVVSTREAAQFSARSAEVTEIRAARSGREQADVLELRGVLDRALLDLQSLVEPVQAELSTWENYSLAVHDHHANTARRIEREYGLLLSRSKAASEAWRYDTSHLDLRLGSHHPLTELYVDTGTVFSDVSKEMATCLHSGCGRVVYEIGISNLIQNGLRDEANFTNAAVKFVNSRT